MAGVAILAGCQATTPFGGGATPKSKLVSTYWQATSIAGRSIETGEDKRQPYILLTKANHRFQGFAGCNDIHGQYQRGGKHLRFKSVAQTRMFCRGDMQMESAFTQALKKTRRAQVHDHVLKLSDANGDVLARFHARIKQFKNE
ncbi:META domain-containing protein [Salinisphaera sp. USBA-960]|nr:META domain-containing protein [Salifodinibacter halophilus]NNC26112.1 META domain-containing protein [Salifodinibacter halophilus]